MKIETNELTGAALDWAVAKAEGKTPKIQCTSFRDAFIYRVYLGWSYEYSSSGSIVEYRPSTDWSQGGPIIERESINIEAWHGAWQAELEFLPDDDTHYMYGKGTGPTPLIAAMRCYVSSKLGGEVDVPEELCPPTA
jgi:hypothetical protein